MTTNSVEIRMNNIKSQIVGFNTFGNSRDEKYSDAGEICAGYILDDYQGITMHNKAILLGISC